MKYSEPLVVQGTSEVLRVVHVQRSLTARRGQNSLACWEFSSIVVVRFLARLSNIITNGRKLL